MEKIESKEEETKETRLGSNTNYESDPQSLKQNLVVYL
jgi:hypothetical protein